MKIVLETERLFLSELSLADAPFILNLVNSPGWLQYIGNRNIYTLTDAEQYLLTGPIQSYQENGFGLWKLCLRESHTSVGMCGLIRRPYLKSNEVDIGYALLPEYTGIGYATEAVEATLAYANSNLHMQQLLAFANPDNSRSVKLLEKMGFRFDRMTLMPGSKQQVQQMSIIFQ